MKLEERKSRIGVLLLALCTLTALLPFGKTSAQDFEVRSGSVLKLSMDTYLTSRSAQIGDPFTATVFEEYRQGGDVAIPRGSKVEGKVSAVTAAQRPSKSGTLGIDFQRLRFPNGRTIEIEAQLTSLDAAEKRQIDEEGRVSGGSSAKRNVVFIGGGAAGGAAIGAIAGGGKGAGVGAVVGAAAGVLGSVLSKGQEAEVQVGQKFGMEVLRPIIIPENYVYGSFDNRGDDRDRRDDRFDDRDRRDDRSRDDRDRRDDRFDDRDRDDRDDRGNFGGRPGRPGADLNAQPMVRRAQTALRDLGYYKGPINGVVGTTTRAAVRTFQRDYDLEMSGNLDFDTALALGLINEEGYEIIPVRVLNATAERLNDGSVRVKANAEANTGGWQVFADTLVDGDTLQVNVKGTPPDGIATQAITRYPVDVTVRNPGEIRKVSVKGSGAPILVELLSPGVELSRTLRQQTLVMLDTYKEATGIGRRGTNEINPARMTESQAQVFAALTNLNNTALFVEQLITVRAPEAGLRGGLNSLLREARQTQRLLDRFNERSRIDRQWTDFENTLRRLSDNYRVNFDQREQ